MQPQPIPKRIVGGGAYGGAATTFTVSDSDGNDFVIPFTGCNSVGTEVTVPATGCNSVGTEFTVS